MKLRNIAYAAAVAVTSAMIVLGTAGTSEAKKHTKKAAPPPPPPVWCMHVYQPVCAVKAPGKMKFTYANACFAAKDGAKVVSQGACKAKKAVKAKKKKAKKAAKKK